MPRKKIPLKQIEAGFAHNAFKPFTLPDSLRKSAQKGKSRIMYLENKTEGLSGGEARIGRVTFSKSGRTIYYQGRAFQTSKYGFKSNYVETTTGDAYWISGAKKNGADRLYGERVPIAIDDDVREEYWVSLRNLPERRAQTVSM